MGRANDDRIQMGWPIQSVQSEQDNCLELETENYSVKKHLHGAMKKTN